MKQSYFLKKSLLGFDYFDPKDTGYKDLWELYQFLKDKGPDPNPLIMDYDDLVNNPGKFDLIESDVFSMVYQ